VHVGRSRAWQEGTAADQDTLASRRGDGSAGAAVTESETSGRKYGVEGTPAWLLGHQLVMGLRPAAEFERLAEYAVQLPR
jgi:protein-disulfide isomerase